MRILLISARYLPHRGGLESVVHHLAQEFLRQGHSVQVVTNRYPRSLPAREQVDGIPVSRLHFLLPERHHLRHLRPHLWLAGWWYRLSTAQALRRVLSAFQPDVVNNHYLNAVAEFSGRCLAGSPRPAPWVISFHGGDVDGEPHISPANLRRFRRFSRQADGLTACSRFLAGQAEALEPAIKGKITVIHNGVDVQRFTSAAPQPSEVPYVLAVGQLVGHKGFDMLIQAFGQAVATHPRVQLWIAGEGQQRAALESLINQQNLAGRVRLLGKVDETRVAALMAGCLFLAVPSRREGFGIVALEGMAAGKAVMASPVGGLPEFLPVPPNRLVQPDVAAWAAALAEWLEPALSGRLKAEENLPAAQRHDWSTVAGQYLQVYEQAIAHG